MSDEALASLAKEGDHGAFEQLVRRYQGRLYSYLAYHAGRTAAEDLFQEICVKWWTHLKGYESRGRFAGWAFTIARRALIDYSERERRRKSVPFEEAGEGVADSSPGPDLQALSSELRERLWLALGSLSEEQREVFLLREYGGLSFKEIAVVQGCPLNTALARMRYALLKLRGLMEMRHG